MDELPKYYKTLFNAITDTLAAMEQQNFGTARELLVNAQQIAEEQYLAQSDEQSEE